MTDLLNGILSANWLSTLIDMILWLFISLISVILLPFSLVIEKFIPNMDAAFSAVANLFDIASTYVGYIIDAIGFPPIAINMIIGYYTFVILATLYVWMAKIGLKWLDTLK